MQRHQQPITMDIGKVCNNLLLHHYYDDSTSPEQREVLRKFWRDTMASSGTYREAYRAAIKRIEAQERT